MRKEVILVQWGECPLDILAQMKEQAEDAWIFLHEDAVMTMELLSEVVFDGEKETLKWTEENPLHPGTTLVLERVSSTWFMVHDIDAPDISFKSKSDDPVNIFFMKIDMP